MNLMSSQETHTLPFASTLIVSPFVASMQLSSPSGSTVEGAPGSHWCFTDDCLTCSEQHWLRLCLRANTCTSAAIANRAELLAGSFSSHSLGCTRLQKSVAFSLDSGSSSEGAKVKKSPRIHTPGALLTFS